MRLSAFLALVPLLAWGGPVMPTAELAPGVQMLPIQDGTARVMSEDGGVSATFTALPAGYWLSMTGYERLQVRMATQESASRVERARADTCIAVATALRPPEATGPVHPAWFWLVSLCYVLVPPAAFWLGRRQRSDPWRLRQ